MYWNEDKLYQLVQARLGDRKLIVISNREPYIHTFSGGTLKWHRPVSGVTEALDPVMRASGGIWVAQGTGDADRKTVDEHDRLVVPPYDPKYTLRRVWLTDEEVIGFYYGFANQVLWPLCHITFTPPVYREEDWHIYKKVNMIFADAIIQEIKSQPAIVLVQDYHFALLSQYLKGENPDLIIGQFWHIPWPPHGIFRTCPWHQEIINGMLGNDLLGFHTSSFCRNFVDSAGEGMEFRADRRKLTVVHRSRTTHVAPFPISVDFAGIDAQAGTNAVEREMAALRRDYHLEDKYIGVGMDRMDYTKGIPERLQALDRFLQDNPDYRGKVVLIQSGMPNRTLIDIYKKTVRRINYLIKGINKKYGTDSWKPVIAMNRQLSPSTMNALRRLAHFCVVSSLHDGMNLVAKEYVSARADGDGVLILSRFTGAAEELTEAILINPFDMGDFACKIKEAIEMPEAERRRRMKNLRAVVARHNIYSWGAAMFSRLMEIAGN